MYTKYLSKISCRLPIAFIGCGVLSFTTACNSLTKYGMNDEECTERKANDLDQESNHRPSLLDAARSRNVPLVKQLVSKKGINANETDETGWSPIHWFLFHGDRGLDGLKILLDLVNIDINQKDASGFTPFMKAIISLSCPESFDVLWEKGKDRIQVNEQDEKGLTALHHAIKNNKKISSISY